MKITKNMTLFVLIIAFVYQQVESKRSPIVNITKAIIPAAGLGTRFLPFTKAVPKEMLPLLNKPAMQVVIEEGIASAISDFCIIISEAKPALMNHFKNAFNLYELLEKQNKSYLIESIKQIIEETHINYVFQLEQLGLGHALLMARDAVKGEDYFGIMLPDDVIFDSEPGLAQLIAIAQKHNTSVIAVQEVPYDRISAYGVIAIQKQLDPDTFEISHVVEKPKAQDAPSNLAIIGRYVLSSKIFDAIEATKDQAVGEIQLTDGIDYLIQNGERVLAYKVKGMRYDLGVPLGWLKANIHLGMKNPDFAYEIKQTVAQE